MNEIKNPADSGASLSDAGLGTDRYEAEERYLRDTLAMLQESYAKAAKPYIDRLVAIHLTRPPAPMLVTLEQAEAMGFTVPNGSAITGSPTGESSGTK